MTIKKPSSRGDPEECSYPHPLIRKRHKSAERPGFSKRSRKAGHAGQNEAEARMAEEVERHEHDVPHALSPSPPRPLKCQIANSQSPRTLERRGETGERADNSLGHHFVDCQRSTLSSFLLRQNALLPHRRDQPRKPTEGPTIKGMIPHESPSYAQKE